jgi:hypothetical protein
MRTASAVRTGWRLVLCALSLALGCSFDAHPSLGLRGYAHTPDGDSAFRQDASPIGNSLDSNGGNGPDMPAQDATTPASQAPDAQTSVSMRLDAGGRSDAGDDSDSGPADAAPKPSMPTRSCQAGNYAGDFVCTVDPTGVTPLVAMAHVTFTLQQPSANAPLMIATSNFSFDLSGFLLAANLSGTLDCTTGIFHADIVDGILASLVLPLVAAPFTGAVDGALDASARTVTGSWSFTAPSGSPCVGPWSASLQP